MMNSNLYVIYNLDKKEFDSPFVAISDNVALNYFYAKTHNSVDNLRVKIGYELYSYKLICLGELNPCQVNLIDFDHGRLVAESNFIIEEELI